MRKPDFFIVGAPKCGTTAMQDYLSQHPDIFMPEKKEPHFFGGDLESSWFIRDRERYLSLFANAENERRIGEASVWYLYSEKAARQIKEFNPEAQAIIMLRNPVDMLYSLHSQFLYNGNEDIRDFNTALKAEGERRKGGRIPKNSHLSAALAYRRTASYAEQVERYVNVFGWDDLRIIIYDDFKESPAQTYEGTLRFLGVPTGFVPSFDVVNPNKENRSQSLRTLLQKPPKPLHTLARNFLPCSLRRSILGQISKINTRYESRAEMDSELRQRLQKEFEPEVERLSKLLDRDLSHWCRK